MTEKDLSVESAAAVEFAKAFNSVWNRPWYLRLLDRAKTLFAKPAVTKQISEPLQPITYQDLLNSYDELRKLIDDHSKSND